MGKKSNRGTKEAVQDRILFGFQKVIRQSGSRDENRPLSLAEQLEQAKRDEEAAFLAKVNAKKVTPKEETYFVNKINRS
jgi:hypothetical protein